MDTIVNILTRSGELDAYSAWDESVELRYESDQNPQDLTLAVRWCAAEVHLLQYLVDMGQMKRFFDLLEAFGALEKERTLGQKARHPRHRSPGRLG